MEVTRRQWLFRSIIVIMVLVIVVRQYVKYRVAPELELQAIELVNLQGMPVVLEEAYPDKNILLTYFASWCGPCHAEVPAMEAARNQLEQHGFVLIHVSDEDVAKIEGFMAKNPSGITYLRSITPREAIGVHTIPTHFVFDKEGILRFKQTNPLDWNEPETIQELVDLVKN